MENENTTYSIPDIIETPSKDITLIHIEEPNSEYTSPNHREKDTSLKNLINPQNFDHNFSTKLDKASLNNDWQNFGKDSIAFTPWKNIENISTRIIEFYDNVVVLECLIDLEQGIYEEREFRASLFEGYDIKIGNHFLLRFFDRQNETRMEIHNDPNSISSKNFPKKDFKELFSNSKLFKK